MAARLKPLLDWVSNVILVPIVLLLAVANIDKILHVFGTRRILAGLLLIALGFGIGWMLGGPGIDTRRALALGTGQRNIAAALVVASESHNVSNHTTAIMHGSSLTRISLTERNNDYHDDHAWIAEASITGI